MSLPPMPAAPMPVQGMRAQINNPPPGTQFRPNAPADITQGLASFVKNYVGMKTQAQEMYKQKFYEGLQAKMAGIPTNDEQLVKWAKKANLPIRTEPYTDEEKAWAQAKAQGGAPPMQNAQATGPAASPLSQALAFGASQSPTGSMPPQPPAPPMAQPGGFMSRLRQGIMGPKVPPGAGLPGTPAGDWLNSVAQAAQASGSTLPGQILQQGRFQALDESLKRNGLNVAQMNAKQQATMMDLVNKAIVGSPGAIQMAGRLGLAKPTQMDDMIDWFQAMGMPENMAREGAAKGMLNIAMGVPQMNMKIMDWANTNAGRFGGNVGVAAQYYRDLLGKGSSNIPAHYNPQELEQLLTGWGKLSDNYPNAPVNITAPAATSMFDGDKSLVDYLSKNYKRASQQVDASSKARLNFDYDDLAQRAKNERGLLDIQKLHAIVDAGGEEGKGAMAVINNPNSSTDAVRNAWSIMTSIANRESGLTVNYGGRDIPVNDAQRVVQGFTGPKGWVPFSNTSIYQQPTPALQPPPPGMLGAPPPVGGSAGMGSVGPDVRGQLRQRISQAFDGLGPEEAATMGQHIGMTPQQVGLIQEYLNKVNNPMMGGQPSNMPSPFAAAAPDAGSSTSGTPQQ
jgi:hypothetical protein